MNAFLQSQSFAISIVIGLFTLALLIASSDQAVKRLVGLAAYFHLSSTFMGMTVVSLATSIPEISAHLTASVGILRGTLDYKIGSAIVLGANIGSDVVQQTLILAVVVFSAGTLYFRRYFLTKSMLPMIATTLMCIVLGWDRQYSRLDGIILFGTFIAYSYYLYADERKYFRKQPEAEAEAEAKEGVPQNGREAAQYAGVSLLSMVVTVFCAQVVLSITERVVQTTGIGGSLIGVVTLGIASALPELTTAISGVTNKEHGISLGTLVGSNITNPLVAIGGGAIVSTYWVPRPLVVWDLPWETITGLILWAYLWFRRGKLGRWGALYFVGLYVFYLSFRAIFFNVD